MAMPRMSALLSTRKVDAHNLGNTPSNAMDDNKTSAISTSGFFFSCASRSNPTSNDGGDFNEKMKSGIDDAKPETKDDNNLQFKTVLYSTAACSYDPQTFETTREEFGSQGKNYPLWQQTSSPLPGSTGSEWIMSGWTSGSKI